MAEAPTFRTASGPCLTRADLECVTGILPEGVIECLTRQGSYLIVTSDEPLASESARRGRPTASKGTKTSAKRAKAGGQGKKRR